MREIALALGSNLGDSASILQGAVAALSATEGIDLTAVSAVFETDPVGGPDQDVYLNAVVLGRTTLDDRDLLRETQRVEREWRRERGERWGPRTLDIDILAIDDERIHTDDLEVPHPRAHERAFVLVPWRDADPRAAIAGHGAVGDLCAAVDTSGVRPTAIRLVLPASGGVL